MIERPARTLRLLTCVLLGAAALITPSCARQGDDAEPEPAIKTETQIGPVRLSVGADKTALRAADRLGVVATIEWDSGTHLEPLEIPIESAGWILVSRTDTPPRHTRGGRLVSTSRLVLEPDLPGGYSIPPARVVWTAADGASGVAETEPLEIEVRPLLDESANLLALAPDRVAPPPEVMPAAANRARVVLGAAVLLALVPGACILAWWLVRRARPAPTNRLRASVQRLETALSDPAAPPRVICDAAADTCDAARRIATTELESHRHTLDLARFAPAPPDPETARDLARRTLNLLRPHPAGEAAP